MEIELKYSLDAGDYRTLMSLSAKSGQIEYQENYFFDTPRLHLRREHFALRLRIVDKTLATLSLKFPLKTPVLHKTGLHTRQEVEAKFPISSAKDTLKHPSRLGGRLPPLLGRILSKRVPREVLPSLRLLGGFKTKRITVMVNNLVLEIDRVTLGRRLYYELEVETTSPNETGKAIRSLLGGLKIPIRPEKRSKFSRLLSKNKRG